MKTEHTPAPWKLQTEGTFDKCGVRAEVTLPASKETGHLLIAECDYDAYIKAISMTQKDHHRRSNDVAFLRSLQEKNARLIASAPDLLLALEYMVDVFRKDCFLPKQTKAIKQAISLINKAKGL